jgi:hypothetical protein
MRYLHQEVDEICKYILASGLCVIVCSNDGTAVPSVASTDAITEMLKASNSLWGQVLNYYLRVAKLTEAKCLPLREAVDGVEKDSGLADFLIVAYQDGGLISVSALQLPFQNLAKPAQWWRPWNG